MPNHHLVLIKNDTIVEDFEFPYEHQLITVVSSFHSEDPDKDEKFQTDLGQAYEKQDLGDYDLVASEYTYQPFHFNLTKTWYFLRKGSWTRTEPMTSLGIAVKGYSHVSYDTRRIARNESPDRPRKRRKRRTI